METFFQQLILCITVVAAAFANDSDFEKRVKHDYADNNGVKIHYVNLGEGPLVVMLHGFPDFWYTWRHQMEVLSENHKVVALDLRGYNRSDKPKGQENYAMRLLVADVVAVIRHLGEEQAVIVGHDWGGAVAWQFAMHVPQMTEKLIILNLPHPRGLMREMAQNEEQQKNSQYARDFQKEGAHKLLTAEGLAGWVKDPDAKAKYVEAFNRSDFEAMLNYYKQNYPRQTQSSMASSAPAAPLIKVKAPVLMFHGLQDQYLLHHALNGTWEWLEKDLTLVTIPDAGHFVQHDAADLVTRTMKLWLSR